MKLFRQMVALLLAIACVACLAACNFGGNAGNTPETEKVFDIVASSSPTKITTFVTYKTADGTSLNGEYYTMIDGDKILFTYSYNRFATVEEMGEMVGEGKEPSRIKTVSGEIYYVNGEYFTGSSWERGSLLPEYFALNLNLAKENLTSYSISDNGNDFSATVDGSKVAAVFGAELSAASSITLDVKTNGTFISQTLIGYTSLDGATVSIESSYTYGAQTVTLPTVD